MCASHISLSMSLSSPTITPQHSDEHHVLLPDIWTLIQNRGLHINPNEMTPFLTENDSLQIPQNQMPVKKRKEFKRTLFTDNQRNILMHWLKEHQSNPYPTSSEKQQLMSETGLNRDQINVWFTNNRVRHGMSSTGQHHKSSNKNQVFYQSRNN